MPEIDLDPGEHSSSYEVKPMSRWWLTIPVALILIGAYANGFADPITWGLVFFGFLLAFALIFVFPRYWLSRRD